MTDMEVLEKLSAVREELSRMTARIEALASVSTTPWCRRCATTASV